MGYAHTQQTHPVTAPIVRCTTTYVNKGCDARQLDNNLTAAKRGERDGGEGGETGSSWTESPCPTSKHARRTFYLPI